MSFDLYFLSRIDGQSWEDAMEALEEAAGEDAAPLTDEDLAVWDRIKGAVDEVLRDTEESHGETHRELSHEPTGIQISQYGTEITLTVPYWHTGGEADRVVDLLIALATGIENATGRVAYDPQADDAFLAEGAQVAADTMTRTVDSLGNSIGKDSGEAPRRSFWARLFGRGGS